MKLNDVVTESLTQEGMWDNLKSKFTKQPAAEPVRQEPEVKGNIPQQHFIGQNADNRVDPQGSGNAPVAQTGRIDPSMGYEAPLNTPTTTYNAPTGNLPPVSSTMPQNMPATPPGKAGATNPTYNVPTGAPATNTMMPTNMQTAASARTTADKPAAPTNKPATPAPTYNVPTSAPATNTAMPTNMQTTASANTSAPTYSKQQRTAPTPTQMASGSDWLPPTPPLNDNPDDIEPQAAAPTTGQKAKAAAAGAAKATGGALKSAGGGIWQGIKDLMDPNAKIARGANKVANKVRADNVKNEVQKWQLVARGMDPTDVENYQASMSNWMQQQYPDADPAELQQIAATVDPNKPATITSALSSALNTQMATRPTMSKKDALDKERKAQVDKLKKDAEDEAIFQHTKDQLSKRYNKDQRVADIAQNVVSRGAVSDLMAPQDLEPQTTSGEEADIISNIKTLDATKQKLLQKLTDVRSKTPAAQPAAQTTGTAMPTKPYQNPAALTPQNVKFNIPTTPAKQTKVTAGGPTPAEQANLEKRIQSAQALPNVTAEGKNFSGILWKQMRESK